MAGIRIHTHSCRRESKTSNCRTRALIFLGFLGPAAKPALSAVLKAARDPDWRVRAQAAQTLGAIGRDAAEAIPVLNEARKAQNAAIRYQARRALALIQKDQKSN